MLSANLKIISALKEFLFLTAGNLQYRNCFAFSQKCFSRSRKLTFEILVLFILRLNKKTLCIELEDFFKELKRGIKCTVSAFSQQRLKLSPLFFNVWNQILVSSFYRAYGKSVKLWKGHKLIACDGSSVSLVNTKALAEHFGGQSNGCTSYTLAKTFYCYDALNEMIVYADIQHYRYGEFTMACDLIDSGKLTSDMILIFDRLYSGYNVAALFKFNEQEVKFIIRVNENYNYAKRFLKSRKLSSIIDLYPSDNSILQLKKRGYRIAKDQALKIRLVRVDLPGKKVQVLMTNLFDETMFPTSEFKYLYSLRWKVESNLDFQKNILQLESMSGQTPITVLQDFFATIFASNLHHLLIKQAQEHIDQNRHLSKYPMKVNNNTAFKRIKDKIISIFLLGNPRSILEELNQLFIRAPLPVRVNRSFPRLRKNQLSKSKHRTFTNYKPAF